MSVDQQDLSASYAAAQSGQAAQLFPIVIPNPDPDSGGPGTLTEFEVNINPCDNIWLPINFDYTLGYNQAQTDGYITGTGGDLTPYPPDQFENFPYPFMACNVFDIIDTSGEAATDGIIISAPIWAFRFNTPNNPWLLWSLKTYSSLPASDGWGLPVGRSDFMRAINGPISRLWARLVYPCFTAQSVGGHLSREVYYPGCRVVLFSSVGLSQQTCGVEGTVDVDTKALLPSPPPYGGYTNLNSGGYVTPQLNTLQRQALGTPSLWPKAGS